MNIGPTTCWQCGKKLNRHPRTGELIFETVGEARLRVHKVCKPSAERVLKPNRPAEPQDGRTPPSRGSDEL